MREITITIAKDASASNKIDTLKWIVIGAIIPAMEATTARLSFNSGMKLDDTPLPVYRDGVVVSLPVTNGHVDMFSDVLSLFGHRYISIVAETSGGVAVAQATAARSIILLVEEI